MARNQGNSIPSKLQEYQFKQDFLLVIVSPANSFGFMNGDIGGDVIFLRLAP